MKNIEIKNLISQACIDGDLNSLQDLLKPKNSLQYDEIIEYAITKGFEQAIYNGKIEIIKYLLTSPDLKNHADIHQNDDYAIRLSSYGGHLETVKFLLTSPLLKEKANPNAQNNEPFRWAAEHNHVEVMQFLMEFGIDPHQMSSLTGNNAFMSACDQNAIDAVKYISKLPNFDLKKSLNSLNGDKVDGFQLACENHEKDFEIVEYLILELGFKPNKKQQQYIAENINHKIVSFAAKLLECKTMYESLDNQLAPKCTSNTRIKI